MSREALKPLPAIEMAYGLAPEQLKMRASELEDITSVTIDELFPCIESATRKSDKDIAKETLEALSTVDLSHIKKDDKVNILASHHGFTLLGGFAYAQMLRTIKDEINRRTGCSNVWLIAGNGLRFNESEAYIKQHGLTEYFEGKVKNVSPIDEGIEIETEIGVLYGLKEVYNADWIIHAHNNDMREIHFHRGVDRIVKPFGMSYARKETRAAYHQFMFPRGSNFIARAIYNSEFVQKKFACSVILRINPTGIAGIDADNDLIRQSGRITEISLKEFGYITTLFNEMNDEEGCIAIIDAPTPMPYAPAATIIFGVLYNMGLDLFDLRKGFTLLSEVGHLRKYANEAEKEKLPALSGSLKCIINNYCFTGYPNTEFTAVPSIIVSEELRELFELDPQNYRYVKNSLVAPDLNIAVKLAKRMTGCDRIIVFDGAQAGINVSRSMREYMLQKAPEVKKKVDEELLPMWLMQRGLK